MSMINMFIRHLEASQIFGIIRITCYQTYPRILFITECGTQRTKLFNDTTNHSKINNIAFLLNNQPKFLYYFLI